MRLEARKYLHDIMQAADLLAEFTAGKQFSDYQENSMLRAMVERKFAIIGEALSKLSKVDSAIVSHIGEHARIISFRNIPHTRYGYAEIDDRLVLDIVGNKLPVPRREVDDLLRLGTAKEAAARNRWYSRERRPVGFELVDLRRAAYRYVRGICVYSSGIVLHSNAIQATSAPVTY